MSQQNDLMDLTPTVRPVSPSDWDAVRRLHGRVACVYRSPSAWHWRYGDAQVGTPSSTGVLALAANRQVAAFVGGHYRWAWSGGQRVQVLVLHDRFGPVRQTIEAHAFDETLLSRCYDKLFERSHGLENPTAALSFDPYAIDSDPSGSNIHAADIVWRVCNLSPLGDAPGCTCLVRPTDFSEPGWDQLCQAAAGSSVTSLLKDRAYLAWRFVRHQGEGASEHNPYWRFAFWSAGSSGPLGVLVLRPGENGVAMLVDAIWPEHLQVLRDGMRQVADFLMARGVRSIRTAVTAANPGLAYLHSLGFTATQALQTEPRTVQIDGEGVLPGAPWSVTLGDSLLY